MDFTGQLKDSGTRTEFATGAVRDAQEGKGRFDLLPPAVMAAYFTNFPTNAALTTCRYMYEWLNTRNPASLAKALLSAIRLVEETCDGKDVWTALALHYEMGAKKYAVRNWERGIPVSRFFDSGVRHILKTWNGQTDEPHPVAGLWNIVGLIQTLDWIDRGILPSTLDDLPVYCKPPATSDPQAEKAYEKHAQKVYGPSLYTDFDDESSLLP